MLVENTRCARLRVLLPVRPNPISRGFVTPRVFNDWLQGVGSRCTKSPTISDMGRVLSFVSPIAVAETRPASLAARDPSFSLVALWCRLPKQSQCHVLCPYYGQVLCALGCLADLG